MDTRILFARHLGEKVLWKNEKELTLHGVTVDNLLCMNGGPEYIPVSIEDCKIIVSYNLGIDAPIPPQFAVVKTSDGYKSLEQSGASRNGSEEANEIKIVNKLCECAGITYEQLNKNAKTRKNEFSEPRQIHMAIRQLITRNESLAQTGSIYDKDHATVLHAIKKVRRALEGWDIQFREKYRAAWELTFSIYPHKASLTFNLEWL
jgi:hypothetical protein